MDKSNSTPSPENIEKAEMLVIQCGAYAETIQRLGDMITELDDSSEASVRDKTHLGYAITHISALIGFLAEEGERLLRGMPETSNSAVACLLGRRYYEAGKEVANG